MKMNNSAYYNTFLLADGSLFITTNDDKTRMYYVHTVDAGITHCIQQLPL